MQHPVAGTIQQIGFPIKETLGKMYTHAPLLGEHTAQILTQQKISNASVQLVSLAKRRETLYRRRYNAVL